MLITFRIFAVIALIGFGFLVAGMVQRRGAKATAILYTWLVVFFTSKEYLTHTDWFNHIYYVNVPMIRPLGIPIVVVFGFAFAASMSLEISRTILERIYKTHVPIFFLTLLSCAVVASICHMIEPLGVINYWWSWPNYNTGDKINAFFDYIHSVPFEGWTNFSAAALFPYIVSLRSKDGPLWRHFPLYILWAVFFFINFNGQLREGFGGFTVLMFIATSSFFYPIEFHVYDPDENTEGRKLFNAAALAMVGTVLGIGLYVIIGQGASVTLLATPISLLLFLASFNNMASPKTLVAVGLWIIFLGLLTGLLPISFTPVWLLGFFTLVALRRIFMLVTGTLKITKRRLIWFGTAYSVAYCIFFIVVVVNFVSKN